MLAVLFTREQAATTPWRSRKSVKICPLIPTPPLQPWVLTQTQVAPGSSRQLLAPHLPSRGSISHMLQSSRLKLLTFCVGLVLFDFYTYLHKHSSLCFLFPVSSWPERGSIQFISTNIYSIITSPTCRVLHHWKITFSFILIPMPGTVCWGLWEVRHALLTKHSEPSGEKRSMQLP